MASSAQKKKGRKWAGELNREITSFGIILFSRVQGSQRRWKGQKVKDPMWEGDKAKGEKPFARSSDQHNLSLQNQVGNGSREAHSLLTLITASCTLQTRIRGRSVSTPKLQKREEKKKIVGVDHPLDIALHFLAASFESQDPNHSSHTCPVVQTGQNTRQFLNDSAWSIN